MPETRSMQKYILFCFAILCFICGTCTSAESFSPNPEPSLYFSFNEGGGLYAIDGSGNGNTGTLHGVSRVENGICGRSVFFDGSDSYIEIPFSSRNHPTGEITVSAWFFTNSFEPQVMVSTYEEGGYRLAFDDGGDLWWTLNLKDTGEVSLPIQHEGISLNEWHHITGTYDEKTVKMYLDGVLRNQMNATGEIEYQYNNYIMLGADAGVYNQTDKNCPLYFRGMLDEVRIYDVALDYSQVMEDRFSCYQEPGLRADNQVIQSGPLSSCAAAVTSDSVIIGPHEKTSRVLYLRNQTEQGTWNVTLTPGSTLVVKVHDFYSGSYPDAWYTEIADENGRITRSISFPNRNNAPLKGVVPSGNATVFVRYFDGKGRFPAKVAVEFESVDTPAPPVPPQRILNYPIIVIYSVSWVTLIAIILVMVWLHRRYKTENKTDMKDK
jgi:hypothetical protein